MDSGLPLLREDLSSALRAHWFAAKVTRLARLRHR